MNYPKLTEQQIFDVAAYHLRLTESSFPKARPELSPKAAQAHALIATRAFGCNSEAVAKLVSIILGEEIETLDRPILPGSIVRCPAGVVMIGVQNKGGELRGLYVSGENVPQAFNPKSCRAASPDEIRAFFEVRHGLRDDAPELHDDPEDDIGF